MHAMLLLLLVLVIPTLKSHADGAFLYALNAPGNVSVNANKINGLPSDFDPDYPAMNTDEARRGLALHGGNASSQLVDSLPFTNQAFTCSDLYSGLEFLTDGTWVALRVDSGVYLSTNVLSPAIDFPGDGTYPDEVYLDLTIFNDSFYERETQARCEITAVHPALATVEAVFVGTPFRAR
jgi:hypothetical protein